MNIPVFDLHCDTALALLDARMRPAKSLKRNDLHIDLCRAEPFSAYAQCFACFTSPLENYPEGLSPEQVFERELQAILAQVRVHAPRIALAKNAWEVEENRRRGTVSALLTIEGASGVGYDGGRLAELREIGFCMSTLGWNEDNPLTGSHLTGSGLTERGRAYVRQAQRVGMIVDVSHISDRGFWDIMDITQAPIVASHSDSRFVRNVSRNLTDEMFCGICETDGVAGINLYADFLGVKPTLDTVCDHIFHYLELDPTGTHIALGGDLDGCDALPEGFSGIGDYPKLAQRLCQRGLDKATVENIFWNNSIEVMKKCCT